MWFLIKTSFWLTVVVLLLPFGMPADPNQTSTRIEPGAAIHAASATVSDLKGFCERQPNACAVGQQAVQAVGERAQVGVKVLYEYLNARFGPQTRATVEPAAGTLTERDLQIPWRG
jgi:Family of unknown function (DUF5330)